MARDSDGDFEISERMKFRLLAASMKGALDAWTRERDSLDPEYVVEVWNELLAENEIEEKFRVE